MKRPRIALLIETSTAYGRGLIQGVGRYARHHTDWQVLLTPGHDHPPQDFRQWRPDAVLVRPMSRSIAEAVLRAEVPTVAFWGRVELPPRPWLVQGPTLDVAAIERMAAEHFLSRGFRHFAYCGFSTAWKHNQGRAFVERLKQERFTPLIYRTRLRGPYRTTAHEHERLTRWLVDLPKPVAVLGSNDARGRHVIDACHAAGLRCPEQVAVLGVGNDHLMCEAASPPLSSIEPDHDGIGYLAAGMLDRLLGGERPTPPPDTPRRLPPRRLIVRQSTDLIAITDPDIARAVALIRDHACEGMTVAELVDRLPLSRAVIERRFREVLHRTPASELQRVRLDHAKGLLLDTDLPLKVIAGRAGYANPQRLSEAFRRTVGMPPAAYRREHRTSDDR